MNEKATLKEKIKEMALKAPQKTAVDVLAEAVAALVDRRDVPQVEEWIRGQLGIQ